MSHNNYSNYKNGFGHYQQQQYRPSSSTNLYVGNEAFYYSNKNSQNLKKRSSDWNWHKRNNYNQGSSSWYSNARDNPFLAASHSSDAQFERSNRSKSKEEQVRLAAKKVQEQRRSEEEKTWEGFKQVTIEYEDDEDFVQMGTVHSIFDPPNQPAADAGNAAANVQQPVDDYIVMEEEPKKKRSKREKREKKRNKKRRRSSSSSRRSSDKRRKCANEEDNFPSPTAASSKSTNRSASDSSGTNQIFDSRRNNEHWQLLKRDEYFPIYRFKSAHYFKQTEGDDELINGKEDKEDGIEFEKIGGAFSEQYERCFPIIGTHSGEWWSRMATNNCSSSGNSSNINEAPQLLFLSCPNDCLDNSDRPFPIIAAVERTFRKNNVQNKFRDFTLLSHQPFGGANDEAASVRKQTTTDAVGVDRLNAHGVDDDKHIRRRMNMDLDDYVHLRRSEQLSWEESASCADINGLYSILHSKVKLNGQDVDSWLEFIGIQRPFYAKSECGNPNGQIEDKKAYFKRVTSILTSAIKMNPGDVRLEIKRLEIMEDCCSAEEVQRSWRELKKNFANSQTMWESYLKMQQNSPNFQLDNMIEAIDDCIHNLVHFRDGTLRGRNQLTANNCWLEDFLVRLLIQRCQLFISAGLICNAVAMLQALAEFHFFPPQLIIKEEIDAKDEWKNPRLNSFHENFTSLMVTKFQKFWESGVLRIGDKGAEGWGNICWQNVGDIDEIKDIEFDDLHCFYIKYSEEKKEALKYSIKNGLSEIEKGIRLDHLKTKYTWSPVRFNHSDDFKVYEVKSRRILFNEIRPILFTFSNKNIAQDLLFKLLHIFGIPIPGLDFMMQEDIMRSFSPILPSLRPISMDLLGFTRFIKHFVALLAESESIDATRLCSAFATRVANSKENTKEKAAALLKLVRSLFSTIKPKRRYLSSEEYPAEWKLSICLSAFEEIEKLNEIHMLKHMEMAKKSQQNMTSTLTEKCLLPELNFAMKSCMAILCTNLDAKNRNIWKIAGGIAVGKESLEIKQNNGIFNWQKRERLLLLRFAIFLARNLPFSDEKPKTPLQPVEFDYEGRIQLSLMTKREFLLSLFLTGKVAKVTIKEKNIKKAHELVKKILCTKISAHSASQTHDHSNELLCSNKWLGDEHELIFELCALFLYEFPIDGKEVNRYKIFRNENPLFTSNMAKSMANPNSMAKTREMRVRVLKHIIRHSMEYDPHNLRDLLSHSVKQFPHSIMLLRSLLDMSNSFSQKIFLFKIDDKQTRFVRDFGRLNSEYKKFKKDLYWKRGSTKGELGIICRRLIGIFQKIAEENSDNLIPDDYIWNLLMHLANDFREHVPASSIDKAFKVGQVFIPWSKSFLTVTARKKSTLDGNNILCGFQKHGLNIH